MKSVIADSYSMVYKQTHMDWWKCSLFKLPTVRGASEVKKKNHCLAWFAFNKKNVFFPLHQSYCTHTLLYSSCYTSYSVARIGIQWISVLFGHTGSIISGILWQRFWGFSADRYLKPADFIYNWTLYCCITLNSCQEHFDSVCLIPHLCLVFQGDPEVHSTNVDLSPWHVILHQRPCEHY